MFKNLTLTFFACIFVCNWIFAQETWSLEKCVRYSLDNNISIKRAQLNVDDSRLVKSGNKMSRLPSLNGSVGASYRFGRTIDPVTNDFNNLSFGTNSLSLNTGVNIYNGNRINSQIKQAGFNIQAAMNDLAQVKSDINLSIASSYLNVLFAEEQLDAAIKRKELTESQLDQVEKLIRAGARPQNDKLEILATIARNEQAIIGQENAVETGLLNLKNLLQLDPSTNIILEKPNSIVISAEDNPDILSLNELYKTSLSNQAFVKADEYRVKSAELGKDIARSGLLPQISAFAGLSTNYSTNGRQVDGFQQGIYSREFIFPDNPSSVINVGEVVDFPILLDAPYGKQLKENFGQNIGLSLNIPIYNNHQNIVNLDRAELNILNNQYTAEINKQNLKNDIQTALSNARTAKRTLAASNRTVEASLAAFQNSEKQFQLGTINTFEYATAKNNLDQAEVDLIIAKYDYIFKLKVLDFYQGKELELK
ncbi:MAG: TolC family protein [Saprospiraceae bacterium]|jgi:outer membrane protein|nr:TolC family protein [Saprospiraceae bacterium]